MGVGQGFAINGVGLYGVSALVLEEHISIVLLSVWQKEAMRPLKLGSPSCPQSL